MTPFLVTLRGVFHPSPGGLGHCRDCFGCGYLAAIATILTAIALAEFLKRMGFAT